MIFEFWFFFLESKTNISIPKIIDWVLRFFPNNVIHTESLLQIIINNYFYKINFCIIYFIFL
jgi:hypothetical protein